MKWPLLSVFVKNNLLSKGENFGFQMCSNMRGSVT
jgi:hypothetical protein